jgi:hypothetical protein
MGAIKRLHKARVRQCATLFLVTGSNLGCGERGPGTSADFEIRRPSWRFHSAWSQRAEYFIART